MQSDSGRKQKTQSTALYMPNYLNQNHKSQKNKFKFGSKSWPNSDPPRRCSAVLSI